MHELVASLSSLSKLLLQIIVRVLGCMAAKISGYGGGCLSNPKMSSLRGAGPSVVCGLGILVLLAFAWKRLPVRTASCCKVTGCSGCGSVVAGVEAWRLYHGLCCDRVRGASLVMGCYILGMNPGFSRYTALVGGCKKYCQVWWVGATQLPKGMDSLPLVSRWERAICHSLQSVLLEYPWTGQDMVLGRSSRNIPCFTDGRMNNPSAEEISDRVITCRYNRQRLITASNLLGKFIRINSSMIVLSFCRGNVGSQ